MAPIQQTVKNENDEIVASGLDTEHGFYVVAKRGKVARKIENDPIFDRKRPSSLGQVTRDYFLNIFLDAKIFLIFFLYFYHFFLILTN